MRACRTAEELDEEEDEAEQAGPQGDMHVKFNSCLHTRSTKPGEADGSQAARGGGAAGGGEGGEGAGDGDGAPAGPKGPLSVPFMKKFYKHAKAVCR